MLERGEAIGIVLSWLLMGPLATVVACLIVGPYGLLAYPAYVWWATWAIRKNAQERLK